MENYERPIVQIQNRYANATRMLIGQPTQKTGIEKGSWLVNGAMDNKSGEKKLRAIGCQSRVATGGFNFEVKNRLATLGVRLGQFDWLTINRRSMVKRKVYKMANPTAN